MRARRRTERGPAADDRRRGVQQLRVRRGERIGRVRPSRPAARPGGRTGAGTGRDHRARRADARRDERAPAVGGLPERDHRRPVHGRPRRRPRRARPGGLPARAPAAAAGPARAAGRRVLPGCARRRRTRRRPAARDRGRCRPRHGPGPDGEHGALHHPAADRRPGGGEPRGVPQHRVQRRGWSGGDAAGADRGHHDGDRHARGRRGSPVRRRRPAACRRRGRDRLSRRRRAVTGRGERVPPDPLVRRRGRHVHAGGSRLRPGVGAAVGGPGT